MRRTPGLRRICDRLGLIWLERETAVLDGVRFVGTTLWSDYDAIALLDDQVADDMGRLLKLRDKAFRAANFYLQKPAAPATANRFWRRPCASRRWCARNGCARPWPSL
jgi:hypothetical protein